MTSAPTHPLAVTISFIDAINHADVARLGTLMAPDFVLVVFDEPPQAGLEGWRGYARSYPNYLIHPRRFAASGEHVAVLGHTTGSHLELPDDEESRMTLLWIAEVANGLVRSWTLTPDTPANRHLHGLNVKE